MKVVLFCGGQGTRLRTSSHSLPKPMTEIGYRPVLWHLMKYYAHYGHTDFILCLGYRADVIKKYFLEYNECTSNDFVLRGGGSDLTLLSRDIDDWHLTFVDTGANANIGDRLRAVKPYVAHDEAFLANYADGLTDLDLASYVGRALDTDAVATFLSVRPQSGMHMVNADDAGTVKDLCRPRELDLWINAGFFVLRPDIFDYMRPGEELVHEPFQRLIAERRLRSVQYDGFWKPMDTFNDHRQLAALYEHGEAPWTVWKTTDTAAVA